MPPPRPPVAEPLEGRLFLDAAPAGPEFVVNNVREGPQTRPSIAADAAGNFVVVWETVGVVSARRFDASGSPAGPEFVLGEGARPVVAMDADGDFVAAWQEGEVPRIRAARFTAAGARTSLGTVPTTDNFGPDTTPSVAMSPGGDFVITWTADYPGDNSNNWGQKSRIYGRLYHATGQPRGPDFRVSVVEHTTDWRFQSSASMDAAGNFVVAWHQFAPGAPWDLLTRRYSAAGAPREDPVPAARDVFVNTAPVVAMDADGDFVVAWARYGTGPGAEVYWRRYDDPAGTWGQPTAVTPGRYAGFGRSALDMDADGNFSIAWTSGRGDESFVNLQCYAPGGEPAGPAVVVDAQSGYHPVDPQVAVDEGGGVVVTWQHHGFDMVWSDIVARRYTGAVDASPPRVTHVFVNSTAWSPRFRHALETRGLGAGEYGYAFAGAAQADALPWSNLDQVSVRFSRDVVVEADDLRVAGLSAAYAFAGAGGAPAFRYDPAARSATWALARPVTADRVTLTLSSGPAGVRAPGGPALDGDAPASAPLGAFPTGDGTPGGDFRFAIDVLPGDADRDRRVTAADVLAVRRHRTVETDDPRAAFGAVYCDINGSSHLNVTDEILVRRHAGRTLPPPPPAAAGAPDRVMIDPPPRRRLYSDAPVLA